MKKVNIGFSMVFLFIIFFFFLYNIFTPDKSFSYSENRTLAQKPKISIENILDGSYMDKMETYVNDQIYLRDDFVKLSTNIKLLMGQKEINGVYLSDGFLVEKFKDSDIDLELLEKNKNDVKTFIDNNHAKFVLIPTAGGVIDGLYPKYSDNLNQKELIDNLYSFIGTENCIDVYSRLKEHSSEYIYYKTDHHWTTLGAYYGYVSICEKLGLKALDLSDFEEDIIDDEFMGTIQSKVNYNIGYDSIYRYLPKQKIEYTRILNEDKRTESNSLYDESKLKSKEKYAVFLGGNNAVTRIKVENGVEDKGKLLIIKDSFSHCLTPFIVNHYSEVVLLDLRYYMGGVNQFKSIEDFDDIIVMYNLKNFVEDKNLIRLNK